MNRKKKLFVRLMVLMFALTATASWAHKKKPFEAVPIPQDISQGDTFVLLKPFDVDSGKNVVYFQKGQVVEKEKIDPSTPYCRLELGGPAAMKQTIKAQHFAVTEVIYDERGQGNTGKEKSITSFSLKPDKATQVKRMACGWPDAAMQEDFLNPEQIATALAGYFTIETQD
jgi:hypothetical protein